MNIPHRYREETFLKQAPLIGRALNQFPAALVHNPKPHSPDFAAQCIRDAVRAKLAHGWQSMVLNDALFLEHAEKLVVRVRPDGMIVLGDAITSKLFDPAQMPKGDATVTFTGDVIQLEQLCMLVGARCFMPVLSCQITGFAASVMELLESKYDIAFAPAEQPGHFLII